ncbi:hypothetical protein EG329_013936 [Mollisiaceae sp. DMI_Dod_QoI]|nr:hypothetical protein EG329_013936 [Helotiales sp. DMI_Dod_QoI]
MVEETPKQSMRRGRRRKQAVHPRSAEKYEQWKAQLSQIAKLRTATAKDKIPLEVPTISDRITNFLSNDTAKPISTESDDKTDALRKKILDQAILVRRQAKAAKKEYEKQRAIKERAQKNKPFRFIDLPPELRIMIYKLVFQANRGRKPTLLWALQINKMLYKEARGVWCGENNFKFSLLESKVNTRDGLLEGEMGLLRRATVIVSPDVQACSKLSSAVLQAENLEYLTLVVWSNAGLGLATHNIIPSLKKLKQVLLHIEWKKRKVWVGSTASNPWAVGRAQSDHFRGIVGTRRILDKMLGKAGIFVEAESKGWRQHIPTVPAAWVQIPWFATPDPSTDFKNPETGFLSATLTAAGC